MNSIEAIIVSLIGLAGSAAGSLGGILVSTRLTQYRLEQLEKKVESHNNLIDRMYKVEGRVDLVEQILGDQDELYKEKIKVANHRIEDLENEHKKGCYT